MKLKVVFLAGLVCAFSAVAENNQSDVVSANVQSMSEEELIAAAERLIEQEKSDQKDPVAKTEEKKSEVHAESSKEESQIPAFRGTEKKAMVESSSWLRMAVGSVVVVLMAFGFLVLAKKFGRKSKASSSKVQLDVVAQKSIGPKQNLVVVRIAGEHILLGATDQSINMIKTISLIDDESEDSLPQDFNNFLEDDFVQQPLSGNKGRSFSI